MSTDCYGTSLRSWFSAALVCALLPLSAAAKGPKISVGDDPSLGSEDAELVLLEIADFQ